MKKLRTPEKISLSALFILLTGTLAISSVATLALFSDKLSDDASTYTGSVGLRSYFEKGMGTATDPYVISRPLHFYNLTRLQNLGVLGDKFYFTLGYDPDNPDKPYGLGTSTDPDLLDKSTLKFYPNDSSTDKTSMITYLDMENNDPVLTIGSEGTPFYGDFDGNGKEIAKLKVKSGPEDVGVFGYTNSGSRIRNVYFSDLSITDDGYSTTIPGVSDLFTTSAVPSVVYKTTSVETTLGTTLTENQPFGDLSGTFIATPPSSLSGLKYGWRSSSEYFTASTNPAGNYVLSINSGNDDEAHGYYCIANNATFLASPDGTALSSRLSFVASLLYEGINRTKVLASYKVSFIHNVSGLGVSSITMKAIMDYVDPADPTNSAYTEYAHGVNIGYLIGHCDGTAENCYVFGGTLHMNSGGTDYSLSHAVKQETETGLIGEVGPAIDNEFSPQSQYDSSGDIGVVNFSGIYKDVIGSGGFTPRNAGSQSYYSFVPAATTSDKYLTYLRRDYGYTTGTELYVTDENNSLSFAGNQLIRDEKIADGDSADISRNLGVFSLATSAWDNSSSSTFTNGIGEFTVKKHLVDSAVSPFSDFYYTTAEFADPTGTQVPYNVWGYGYPSYSNAITDHIEMGYRLPSFVDGKTWNPSFEKHFNYIFHCPLSASSTSNYFYNSQSSFLQKYWSYKLIDKYGNHLSYGTGNNKDFGVFVKDVDLTKNQTSSIGSFDSYLKMSAQNSRTLSTITVGGKKMPTKSIDFSIKSENGGNVTVMAASPSGSGGYVSIYDKSITMATGFNYAYQHPSYTMYIPYSASRDSFAYFDYSYGDGTTASDASWSDPGEKLFAHTFFLPKGDYYIGSPSGDIFLYYVAAQGQEGKGNAGDTAHIYSTMNAIRNTDFISLDPTDANFVLADDRCYLSFKGAFSEAAGSMGVTSSRSTLNTSTVGMPANLTSLLIYNEHANEVIFNGTTYTTKFINYP